MINKVTNEYKLSKTAFFITLSSLVLSAYSGQQNILFNIVSSNRTTNNTSNLIGLFVRFLPMLIKMENLNLIELIRKYMDVLMTLYSFNVPYLKVKNDLNLYQCNSLFKFDPYEINNYKGHRLIESITPNEISKLFNMKFPIKEKELDLPNEYFDFVMIINEFKNYYSINFYYNEELFNENIMNHVANQLLTIMKGENYYSENVNTIIHHIKSMNNMNHMLYNVPYEINENRNIHENNILTNSVVSKKNSVKKQNLENNNKFKNKNKNNNGINSKVKDIFNMMF